MEYHWVLTIYVYAAELDIHAYLIVFVKCDACIDKMKIFTYSIVIFLVIKIMSTFW